MISWLPHRRGRIEQTDAEAEALIHAFREQAYSEALRREREASSGEIARDWSRVARAGRAQIGCVSAPNRDPRSALYPTQDCARQRKILMIAPSTRKYLGGHAVQANRLLDNFRAEQTIDVQFSAIDPQLPRIVSAVHRVKYIRTVVALSLYCYSLLTRVPSYNFLHIFSAAYWSFLLASAPAIIVGRMFGKRVILNYRSGAAEDHLTNWRRSRWILKLVDQVVVPSGYLVDIFAKHGLKATAIPNIVDPSVLPYRERSPVRPFFICNRNLESRYNVQCVIRAFSIIQATIPSASLTIIGSGSCRRELVKLVQSLKLQRVVFLGSVCPEKMGAYLDSCDIYLNGSLVDNMPTSLIEAFSAGLPAISSRAGGIPYFVEDRRTALLFDCDKHEQLAELALELLSNAELSSMLTSNAKAEVLKYTWEAVRSHWLNCYGVSMTNASGNSSSGKNAARVQGAGSETG